MESKKNSWVAAILNFILPGLGYVYTGKRIEFGVGLILWGVFSFIAGFIYGFNSLYILDIFLSLLFAYDGYKTAEEVNKGK